MAIEKQIKSRIIHKHDTEVNWNKATTFVPNQGEIIIYDIDENYAYERMKIGDGTTTIINLPFVMDNLVNVYIQKTSITDNLTTTAKDKPLSANQGYVLNQAVTNKADKTSLIVLDEPIIINLTLESNEVYTLSTPIELIEKEIWHCESYCVSEGVEYHDFGLGRVLNDGNDNLSISFLNGCGVLTNTTFTNGNSLANTFTISKVLEYNKTPNYLIDQTEGTLGVSSGKYSHAEGHSTTAVGSCSHAEGQTTIAMGNWSHTEGKETSALKSYGHAEGLQTLSDGQTAHAEGAKTKAIGIASHAEGYLSAASYCAHAEGYSTSAEGDFAHAEGDTTIASGVASHAEGTMGQANKDSELIKTTASGVASHAEGVGTQATEDAAHSEGGLTIASGYASHAEGDITIASGVASHAEGTSGQANKDSELIKTTASGMASHAEGVGTQATEDAAHSEGSMTIASGYASHAEGCYTIAAGDAQHVEGIANIEDTESKYIHITGNGAWDARSNAYHLDWSGNAWYAGDVYVGSTSGVNKDEGSKKLATEEYVDSKVVQSDWNQNDESAPDYVKNRFGGYYEDTYSTVFEEATVNFTFSESANRYEAELGEELCLKVAGEEFLKVTFDGVEYKIELDSLKFEPDETTPFGLIMLVTDPIDFLIYTTIEGDTHTVEISIVEKSPVPIDAKFLPDTVATKPSMTRITLSASGWDNTTLTQSVSITGISADETAQLIQCAPTGASMIVAANSGIYCSGQAADTLTFKCTSIPTENVQFIVSWQDCVWIEPVVVTPTMINFTFNDYMSFEVENGTTWQEFIANDNTFYIVEDGSVIYPGSDCYVVYNGINVKASDVIVAGNYEYGDRVPPEDLI